jgi:hypothetical protein
MKKGFLLCSLVLISTAGLAAAAEDEIGVTFDLTYLSKWVTKGASAYGQQGAFFEKITFDWWGSGFGSYVIHRGVLRGNSNKERLDYGVFYKGTAFEDQSYMTKYKLRWAYEHYPNIARHRFKTTNEWVFSFVWPRILGGELIPKYTLFYEYPAGSKYTNHDVTGFHHCFALNYDLTVPPIIPGMAEHVLTLGADISYRDGIGGRAKDEDWSHSTLSVATNLKITDNITLTPGLYYQLSMDDSVSPGDILYTTINMRYKF